MIDIEEISASKPSGTTPAVYQPYYRQKGKITFRHALLWLPSEVPGWIPYHIHLTQEDGYVKCELILTEPLFDYGESGPAQHFGQCLVRSNPRLHEILESGFNPETKRFEMISHLPTYGEIRWFSMQVDSLLIRLDELANPQFERGFLFHTADSVSL